VSVCERERNLAGTSPIAGFVSVAVDFTLIVWFFQWH
jgi:hypothetical protein